MLTSFFKVVFVSLIFATIFKSMREEKPPSIDLDELRKASSHYNGDSRQNFLGNEHIKYTPLLMTK